MGGEPCGGLRAMRAECDAPAGKQRHKPYRGIKMSEGRSGQYGAGRNADKGVDRVPNGIDHRYFVGGELHEEQTSRHNDDPPILDEIEIARQVRQMKALQQSESYDSSIQVDAGEPGRTHRETA